MSVEVRTSRTLKAEKGTEQQQEAQTDTVVASKANGAIMERDTPVITQHPHGTCPNATPESVESFGSTYPIREHLVVESA